jgi:hypothetical protein
MAVVAAIAASSGFALHEHGVAKSAKAQLVASKGSLSTAQSDLTTAQSNLATEQRATVAAKTQAAKAQQDLQDARIQLQGALKTRDTATNANPTPEQPASTAASATATVQGPDASTSAVGQVDAAYILSDDVAGSADGTTCKGWEPTVQLKDGSGAIVALGRLSGGHASGRKDDGYSTSWNCSWQYTVQTTSTSPVFTVVAFVDYHGQQQDPDSQTVDSHSLARGSAPRLSVVHCIC